MRNRRHITRSLADTMCPARSTVEARGLSGEPRGAVRPWAMRALTTSIVSWSEDRARRRVDRSLTWFSKSDMWDRSKGCGPLSWFKLRRRTLSGHVFVHCRRPLDLGLNAGWQRP